MKHLLAFQVLVYSKNNKNEDHKQDLEIILIGGIFYIKAFRSKLLIEWVLMIHKASYFKECFNGIYSSYF